MPRPRDEGASPDPTSSTWDEWWEANRIDLGTTAASEREPDSPLIALVRVRYTEVSMSVFLFIAAALLALWARKNGRENPRGLRWLHASVALAALASVAQMLVLFDLPRGGSFEWSMALGAALTAASGIATYVAARRL